jgi:hypothetical protein
MEEFIDDLKIVMNALGYKVLEPLIQKRRINSPDSDNLLYLSKGSADAKAITTTEGFVVLQGARINENMNAKSLNAGIVQQRERYLTDGKIKDWTTTEDLLFSSSSAAAAFILGYNVSGPQTWKDSEGKSLKEIETEKNE